MPYNKIGWESGLVPLSKANLSAMDNGIYKNASDINDLKTSDKSNVKNSLTIAGLELTDPISVERLREALLINNFYFKSGKPTTSTEGRAGDFWCNKLEKKIYLCSKITASNSGNIYTWTDISEFISISDEVIESLISDYLKENPISGTGADGKSAYQIALDNGFEGTETEWLESLKGADGKDGSDGQDGFSPSISVSPTEDGYDIAIDHSESFTENIFIKHGKDGKDGTSTNIIPEYWQSHLNARADSIRKVMEKSGRNKSAFLFYSDAHWDNGSKNAPTLLSYLTTNTAINKTLYGGDIVSTEPTAETLSDRSIMKYLWDWRSQIRNLKHYSVVGNHDDGNATNNIFSSDYVYSFLFAPEENNDIIRGSDTYYYFDDKSERTRYLCLDTAYEGLSVLSTAQSDFTKEALKSTPENWHIVVLAHIWYVPDYDQYNVRPIPLTGLSTTATQLVAILDNYNARVDEFSDSKAKIEFCIGGHVHRDYVDKTTGGIPIVLCECAGMGYRGNFSASTGTASETAVSGIVADYNNDKITVIRIGRGNSFEVDLITGETTDIPEDEPIAPDEPTYTNVLETVGWTDGIRLSGNDGGERDNANSDTTGFIPCVGGNTIYLKNVQMKNGSTDYCCFVSHFAEDKSFIGGYYYNDTTLGDMFDYIETDENGYYKQFRVQHQTGVAFIRITCLGIDDTSIITVNKPIE